MDIQTIDENYRALETQSKQTVQALTAVAGKLQAAAKAGDPNAREWLLDLKEVALHFREEQNQVRDLLRALHGYVESAAQADRETQAQQAQQAQAQAQAQQAQQNLQAQGYPTPQNTPPQQYQQPQYAPPPVQYVQPPPVQYAQPAYYPPPYPAAGYGGYGYGGRGYYGGFMGSGFGEAMVIGAEIGIAEAVIDDLFWW